MPKSYNNAGSWDEIEKDSLNRVNKLNNQTIHDVEFTEDMVFHEDENFGMDTGLVSSEIVDSFDDDDSLVNQIDSSDSGLENFDEVLELTQYTDSNLVPSNSDKYIVAEYNDVKVVEIEKRHTLEAKSFVSKITKFVLDFNDTELTKEHKAYIKQVGELQYQHLADLLYLVDVNKQIINNIVSRVNATQAEDYAIIQSYNNLVNQHLKLIKEASNLYRSIPSTMKKMRADVLCDQDLTSFDGSDEIITENMGVTQFNNSKQMIKSLLEKRKLKSENPEEQTT